MSRYEDFWNWTGNVLVNGLYNREFYNGEIYTESLIVDRQSLLVGGARLRQVRIQSHLCDAPMNYLMYHCEKGYSVLREDQDNYLPGWEPVDLTKWSQVPNTYYTYRGWDELDGYPYVGQFGTYGGGGYVAELGTDKSTAEGVLQFLQNTSWINSNTRAIIVEFNLYNPNLNLWGVCMYLMEFIQTGGLEMSPKWHILRLDRYIGPFMYFVMAMEFITIIFVIYFTVREIRQMRAKRLQYFKEFWNWWELGCLALLYAIIILFIYRTVINTSKMNDVSDNTDAFTNLHYAVLLDELCGYMIAFLVYMYTIRFIRLLRFNRKISVLGDTLMHVGKPIVNFMIVFIVAFCAFAMTAYIFFGRNLRTFRNFVTTLETLISMMLNKFDYASMMAETKVVGPVMFGFFCLVFNIILINFFITVILEGFTAVRYDKNKQSNEYEIVEFITRRVKMTLGVGQLKKKTKSKGVTSDPRKNQFVYVEKLTPEMEKINELDGKVDIMINKLEDLTDVAQEQEELKDEIELCKRRKKIVIG